MMTSAEDETDCAFPAAAERVTSFPVIAEMPPEYPDDAESTPLLPCSICGRTFAPTALQRHSKVCEKLQAKKRSKFDSTKQRYDGLDLSPPGITTKEKKDEKKIKSRWREKHQEFLRTIRAAKGDSSEEGEGGSQRNIPSDYIRCPHCDRYFGPKAADRHINWCGEQKSRLPRSQTSEDSEAVQRLKQRTKYTPPKPGQNGWRAPKKKDVISSIPPPNVGPNLTPPGRLVSPPPPAQRHTSPPPLSRPHTIPCHSTPLPISPSRKSSSASLPPGPPRYSTSSLGRSAGRQFAAMLQSVTGCSPGYGLSSGYGSPSLYGAIPHHQQGHPTQQGHPHLQGHPPTFNRSASLRLPRKKTSGGGGRMARRRDLASDMLASVSGGGKAKREEPEGDEASNTFPLHDRSPHKVENAPYDPFCAAELQLQDLLRPSEPSERFLRSEVMGSTSSLKHVGLRRFSPERDFASHGYSRKPRLSNLLGGGSLSLCSLGFDSLNLNSCGVRSPGEESSELESLESSPTELRSPPSSGPTDFLSRFSSGQKSDADIGGHGFSNRNSVSPTRSVSTQRSSNASVGSGGSMIRGGDSPKPYYDTSKSWRKSPSPIIHSPLPSSRSKSPSKERSPSPQTFKPSPSLKRREPSRKDLEIGLFPDVSGWMSNAELACSPKIFSRHFGDRLPQESSRVVGGFNFSSPKDEGSKPQKTMERLEDHARVSSSSSSDSSLPNLSSPSSASPTGRERHAANLPLFCYECGNKYPVVVAKFCCHCGAKRLMVAE